MAIDDRIRTAVLRLLSEGRKAAFRVLMLAQRFEATAVGGGYARDQFALRLSFRVPADSLEMLHGTDLGTPPPVVQATARHAHIDVTMAIDAHTNLDAMRRAPDAIEWEDL